MTTRENSRARLLVRIAVAAGVALLALAATASADPPPAAVGTTAHGFLVERGVLTSIDHPAATTAPATPNGQAGTATLGINDRGQILGLYEARDGVVHHFVLDRKGRFTDIPAPRTRPPGQSDELVDINNRGEIVGFYNDDQGATTTGFLRTRRGRFVNIDVPGSQVTGPLKINDRGQVAGISVDGDGALHGFVRTGQRYETIDVPDAVATAVLGINDRGQTVGSWIDADGSYHGFVRDRDGTVTTLPQAPGSNPAGGGTQPTSINDRGQIVGLVDDAQGGSRAFRYEHGRYTLFDGTPRAAYTRASDINNKGEIVGDYGTTSTPSSWPAQRAGRRSGVPPTGFEPVLRP